jgi:hypothetical protein
VTGRSDQKFLPRVAWSVVMRISVAAAGGVRLVVTRPAPRARGRSPACPAPCRRAPPADRPSPSRSSPRFTASPSSYSTSMRDGSSPPATSPSVSSSAISPRARPRRSMSFLDDHAVEPRHRAPRQADVVVTAIARHGEHAESLRRRRVPHEVHQSLDRRRVVRIVHEHSAPAAHANHVEPSRRRGRRRKNESRPARMSS